MERSVTIEEVRERIRDDIKRKFTDLVAQVRASGGSMTEVADQIGVKRTMLDQYANKSMPGADVLLAAFLAWDWTIRIDNPGATPSWCEFSISNVDGGFQRKKRQPIQLTLFEALTDLDEQMGVLKKTVGRVEFEVHRAFGTQK